MNSPNPLPCATPEDMDPLIAKIYRNSISSNLLRLPDDLLILITAHLDFDSWQCLRKVSRQFLYLFSFSAFERYQSLSTGGYTSTPWPMMKEKSLSTIQRPLGRKARMAKARADYCDPCFRWFRNKNKEAANRRPELEYFHCSGCGSDHHARLFSAAELCKPRGKRVCIGRQGYISLCNHINITFAQLQQARAAGSGRRLLFNCEDASHTFAKNHTQRSESVYLEVSEGRDGNDEELTLGKRTHVTLLLAQSQTRPTAQQLRLFLKELQQSSPTLWYPMENPRLSPMNFVDPNNCHCFDYKGSDQIRFNLRLNSDKEAIHDCLWSGLVEKYPAERRCDRRAHHNAQATKHFNTGFSLAMWPCTQTKMDECFTMTHWRFFTSRKPWEPQWIFALNPKSLGRLEFAWKPACLSRKCRNFMLHETYGPLYDALGGGDSSTIDPNRPCRGKCRAK